MLKEKAKKRISRIILEFIGLGAAITFKKATKDLNGNTLLVTHGGVIDVILCYENGKIYTNKYQTYVIGNAEIICINNIGAYIE